MNAQDQNKKTLRHFQCRDYLWEAFEQMSAELECSTDYLINEAMRQYARSRNYSVGASSPPGELAAVAAPTPAASPRAIPSLRPSMPARATVPAPPRRAPTRPQATAQPAMQPAMPPARRLPSSMPPPPPPRASQPRVSLPAGPPPHPPMPVSMPAPPPRAPARPVLYCIFNGQKVPVTKDEWIIGRGKKSADLAIRDGNISRRHAAVVFQNGAYYVKDLGSTNGIEYQGRRIDTKRVEEGDLIRVCDYELRFTYQ